MAFKVLLLAAVVAVAHSVVVPAPIYGGHGPAYPSYGYPAVAKIAAPVYAKVAAPIDDYDPNPQYSYSYDIHDAITGDAKSQQESRSGDTVQGSYSLIEPDGTRRIVEYTADPIHGFNAVVHKEPVATKVIAKIAAPYPYGGYHH